MKLFDIPITKLYGVGAVRAQKYAKMGISSVGDLLMHYPRGYEDRGDIRLLRNAEEGRKNAFLLTVATQPKSVRIRGRMSLLKFCAYDESASCEITFFNQDYLKNVFVMGQTYRFYGKAVAKGNRYEMTSPAYEPWNEEAPPRSLVSVYPLSEGLSQKQVSKDVSAALTLFDVADSEDIIPEDMRLRHSLCTHAYAVRSIHSPDSYVALAAAKKRLIFEEFFGFALGVLKQGQKSKKLDARPCNRADASRLISSLPFEPTLAQLRVIDEIRQDMAQPFAMNRMVLGDVGSGKTLCAAAAMLFAVQSGHQAALMAPTEILARQHYASLCEMLSPFGIKIELLLGATPAAQKKKIYASLAQTSEGRTDIVVGTQALISDGVSFSSLGLAVIDEQHRFGVAQRAALAESGKCHVLVMSATPIPRSLALAFYGDLEISYLDEMPKGRQRVDTFLVDESYRERLNGFICKQVAQGGQVYIVCPSIEESQAAVSEDEEADLLLSDIGLGESLLEERRHISPLKSAVKYAEELSRALPELCVDFLHGKLNSKQKDEKMSSFVNGKTDVLVSTTVIEVGVNVPSASLMIVENAERFGLSQLHQLRGRVGRGLKKSYCILVSESANAAGGAHDRLSVLKNSYDGFAIAQKDLEMRGPGDFLHSADEGKFRQSGGVRFKLAQLCDDTGLMSAAFDEARELILSDSDLSAHPALAEYIEHIITPEGSYIN